MRTFFMVLSLAATFLVVSSAEEPHQKTIPSRFEYAYGVSDFHTGDHHGQSEYIKGEKVKGAYYLKEADGTVRVVRYIAKPHLGFKAVVRRNGLAKHPQPHGGKKARSFFETTQW